MVKRSEASSASKSRRFGVISVSHTVRTSYLVYYRNSRYVCHATMCSVSFARIDISLKIIDQDSITSNVYSEIGGGKTQVLLLAFALPYAHVGL